MSFQSLPVELFLHIVSFLPPIDQQCLRITCRPIKKHIRKGRPAINSFRFPGIGDHPYAQDHNNRSERLCFLKRLFRPGNLFFEGDPFGICGICQYVRSHRKFPLPLLIEKDDVCTDCIGLLLREGLGRGYEQTFKELSFFKCDGCNKTFESYDIQRHVANGNGAVVQLYCFQCHLDYCSNVYCAGWDKHWIMSHLYHFCKSHNTLKYCVSKCPNCPDIGKAADFTLPC